ncbi:glycosyltransferase family 2 protein [Marinobacterium jannaschii]|uniref:glycosyltransferase family 2 protein n=1 Tax=Marinobacterium jannaschii TaxID=64970 RepID=UPI000685E974|nr:glycosyltransferase [Marinobacterium jannaschii]
MKLISLVFCLALLSALAVTAVLQIFALEENAFSLLHQVALVVLFGFSILLLLRYVLLMLFSLAKNIQRTARYETESQAGKRVSVIVPAYNEARVIEKSVLSIVAQTYPLIEVVVVDDGSTDDTFQRARQLEFDDGVRSLVAVRKPNGGKASALNIGIEQCRGELVMVVDADSKLSEDAIERLVRYFDDPDIGAVAGSVYVSNRHNLLTRLQALEYIEGLNMVRNGQSLFELVTIIPGPVGVFRRSALAEVGGYESDTFAEDADLTMKLIAHGYRIDFEPEAFAHTEAPDELLDLLKQRYRWTRGILQSINKHRSYLLKPLENTRCFCVLWYMLFESVMWPVLDLFGMLFFIYVSIESGTSAFIFYWWLLFSVLDVAGALYCILTTHEDLSLSIYALIYRLYFIAVINISKIFATFDECINLKMDWGKLDRKGGI